MISVENFYYVLYKNLLEPSSLRAKYFYPFGSTADHNLQSNWSVDKNISNIKLNSVLFYDQEPLLCKELPILDTRFCTLLANSEKSAHKKGLIKKFNVIDWYYFYHGFAALYWFNDYKYLPEVEHQFSRVFISLNRLHTNYRSYRMYLISEYIQRNLLEFGHISFMSDSDDYGNWISELNDPNTLLPSNKLKEIGNNLNKIKKPLIVDSFNVQGWASADCGPTPLKLNQSALWHIVSETIFYQEKLHLTEKIFKPICSRRPFILVGAKGNLEYLKSYGFRTFSQWIDESYDKESDNEKRLQMIVDQIERLCKLSSTELCQMHKDMQDVLTYNFNYFYYGFKAIIVDEMLDNFQTALNIWNNDRLNEDKIITTKSTISNFQKLILR